MTHRQPVIICLLALLVVGGSLGLSDAVSGTSPVQSWTLSGVGFAGGAFQNVTLANESLELSPRLEPSNRTILLGPGSPGAADSAGTAWQSVLREPNGSYKMYYTGWNGAVNAIMLANSTDGMNWTKYGVVLAGATSYSSPFVLKLGSVYDMWFEIYSASGPLGGTDEIYYATSPDGIGWTDRGLVLGLGPSGAWDSAVVSDPRVVVDSTGLYRMYYTGWDTFYDGQIGVATSRDLTSWTRYSANPVLHFGASGAWDNPRVAVPGVAMVGSNWAMYYHSYPNGSSAASGSRIGRATSSDGYNWTKDPANPVITPESSPSWDDLGVWAPEFVMDSAGPRLYFSGTDGTAWRIGLYSFSPPPTRTDYGSYVSPVFDSSAAGTTWIQASANATVPPGTSLSLRTRVGNGSAPDNTWSPWATDPSSLPRTRYAQLRLDFASSAWNLTPSVGRVTLDYSLNTGPDAVPSAPSSNSWTNDARPLLRWNLTDLQGDPSIAERVELSPLPDFSVIFVDSGNLTPGTTSWQAPLLPQGIWYWRVQAEDIYGAWGAWQSARILLDVTPPSLSVSNPAPGALLHSSVLDVVWSASDGLSGVDHIEVSLDARAPVVLGVGNSSTVLEGLSDGPHTIRVVVVDQAGNEATISIQIVVDTAIFSPSGPYGAWPLAAVVLTAVGVSVLVAFFLFRRRKGPSANEKRSDGVPDIERVEK